MVLHEVEVKPVTLEQACMYLSSNERIWVPGLGGGVRYRAEN